MFSLRKSCKLSPYSRHLRVSASLLVTVTHRQPYVLTGLAPRNMCCVCEWVPSPSGMQRSAENGLGGVCAGRLHKHSQYQYIQDWAGTITVRAAPCQHCPLACSSPW